MSRSRTGPWLAALLLIAIAPTDGDQAAAQSRLQGPRSCFDQLQFDRSGDIDCRLVIRPEGRDLADLANATYGYLRQVTCIVDVRIARRSIDIAVTTPDNVLEIPPQPVTCDVTANFSGSDLSELKVATSFAPRIVFQNSSAVDATPGLKLSPDLPRALSWPVEAYVNSGAAVRDGMLQFVNAWAPHLRAARTTSR